MRKRSNGRAGRSGLATIVTLATAAAVVSGCTMYRYDPVREIEFERLAEDGCGKSGDKVLTNAEVNQVYEDSLVLWDGREPNTTYTLHIRGPGMMRKTKSLVGRNRYERAYDALQEVMRAEDPVTVTFVCKGDRKAPVATRVSFRPGGGDEIAYEFD